MTPTVFVTGVTGYIGGDALTLIRQAHPDWKYRFLVRSEEKGKLVLAAFPSSEVVVGDLDAVSLLEAEAARADVVIHFASSDLEPAINALIVGLASHEASRPGYLIHTSGTGILQYEDSIANRYGEPDGRVYDDVADIQELVNFPEAAMHRNVDKLVQDAPANVRRLIICPPTILGTGRGPVNNRSIQLPFLIELIRQRGRGFQVGRGLARWSFVDISDLAQMYLLAVEDAASGGSSAQVWGREAYFFAENGEREWGEVARRVAATLHRHEPSAVKDPSESFDELPPAEALKEYPLAAVVSINSRSRATRARQLLGWRPQVADFDPVIDAAVEFELRAATKSRIDEFMQGMGPALPPHLALGLSADP